MSKKYDEETLKKLKKWRYNQVNRPKDRYSKPRVGVNYLPQCKREEIESRINKQIENRTVPNYVLQNLP